MDGLSDSRIRTPVLLLIFNRPDMTVRVFERIRDVRPEQLFIAADGPRPHGPSDVQLCNEARNCVLDRIDWPCEVKTLFRDENLGCKDAVSSAITWFFEHVDQGIILEDDCLPDPSFFPFCGTLLEKYRNTEEIMMISGDNFQPKQRGQASYYFSRYVHIWGWATWRRAWKHYDLSMEKWPDYRDGRKLYEFLPRKTARKREQQFNRAYSGNITTWDTQWVFACWEKEGLSILPNSNLITNIDTSGGTHMKIYDPCIHRALVPMEFPLAHPLCIEPHIAADAYTRKYVTLRGWEQTLWLIAKYLFRTLISRPARLPSDIKTILHSILNEYHARKK